jgi:hypothetical protein
MFLFCISLKMKALCLPEISVTMYNKLTCCHILDNQMFCCLVS